ncbi:hypothetical protein PV325_012794 [Microctonus aethiopoides]|nr:hypothetical protein PV325_012794 [Microctonus aethiopoides]
MKKVDPCKKYACQLQTCLRDNVYQPSRCEAVIEELRQCCIKHSDRSLVCEGIDTTKPYEHKTVDYVTRDRLKKYPLLINECKNEAVNYAKCVVMKSDIGKGDCNLEFMKFKACITEAAIRNKTKL